MIRIAMRWSSFWVTLWCILQVPGSFSTTPEECTTIANLVKSTGFPYPWWDSPYVTGRRNIPTRWYGQTVGARGPHGSTCSKENKCCPSFDTHNMKTEMARAFGRKWFVPKLDKLSSQFKERKTKFDVTFKSLLISARASFHSMFEKTYGMLYIKHAKIFYALFSTLEEYFDSGRDSLEEKLNEFFAILTKKMFVVLNAQYDFDEKYLTCAAKVIREKQGDNLHRQIVSSLRRSFVATRALSQGLNEADRVVSNMQKLKLTPECLLELNKMLYCPICSEISILKPCLTFCLPLIKDCLGSTLAIIKPWDDFITALEGILDRLLGSYNVEAVVGPIHIKISEAIMNFQESGPELSQAVFTSCGKPRLESSRGRSKRGANGNGINRERFSSRTTRLHGNRRNRFRERPRSRVPDSSPNNMEKLLKEIRKKVKRSRNIWANFSRRLCKTISSDFKSRECWNGTNAIRGDEKKESLGSTSNDAFDYSRGPPNLLVAEQVLILQLITDKLRASYNGLDVKWVEDIETFETGSGVGSGSGDYPTDLEEDDDDDPSGELIRRKKPFGLNNGPTDVYSRPNMNIPVAAPEDRNLENSLDWNLGSKYPIPRIPINPANVDNNRNGYPTGKSDPHDHDLENGVGTRVRTHPPNTKVVTNDLNRRSEGSPGDSGTDTGKAVALFRLFTPIIVPMIGKLFSFS